MSVWQTLLAAAVIGLANLAFAADPADPIDINTASAEMLADAIHGVGLKRARAIVSYREEHGAFSSVDELTQIRGIGEKTVERSRDRLTAGATGPSGMSGTPDTAGTSN